MKFLDILRYAYYALKERKVRSLLTILGIVIGPAAIVALTSTTQGYTQHVESQITRLGVTTIMVTPHTNVFKIEDRHVEEILSIEGVKGVYPFYIIPAKRSTARGEESTSIFAINLMEGLSEAVPGLELEKGELPEPFDYTGAVLGYGIAHPEEPNERSYDLHDTITLEFETPTNPHGFSKTFLVKGIFKEFGPIFILNPDKAVFVPIESGRLILGSSHYTGLLVVTKSSDLVDTVMDEIKDLYGKDVDVISVKVIIDIARNILSTVNMILISVASISVLVAFIGIMTTMFTSTIERTREIGILKALGFSKRDIMVLFLAESTLMGLIGGLIGSVTGIGLSFILAYFFGVTPLANHATRPIQIQPVISPEILILAVAMATSVGALAGLIPAWRASKLAPVEALRYE